VPHVKQQIFIAAIGILMIGCGQATEPVARAGNAPRPDFSGMWSDPPADARIEMRYAEWDGRRTSATG
jgi:hypothetical protein